MDLQDDPAAMRASVTLLDGETAFDGWAVESACETGLVWITNLRVVFAGRDRGVCVLYIGQIHRMRLASPTDLRLEAWHQHLPLTFSSASQCAAFRNLLRQDSRWRGEVESLLP